MKIKPYGLITSDNKTILYRVIDSLKTQDVLITEKIISFFPVQEKKRNDVIVLHFPKQSKSVKNSMSPMRLNLISYRSLSFLLTEDKFTRYSINTIFSPGFSKYWIFSLGGMFGFPSNDYSSFFPSYTFGTGGSYDFDKVRINLLLNYSRSYNPENIRTAKNKSIGRDLFGLNFNMQYKYGADSNYNFSIGVLQYLDDYSIKNSINQFNIYLGLGFNFGK